MLEAALTLFVVAAAGYIITMTFAIAIHAWEELNARYGAWVERMNAKHGKD